MNYWEKRQKQLNQELEKDEKKLKRNRERDEDKLREEIKEKTLVLL